MSPQIDLVYLGNDVPHWPFGESYSIEPTPQAIHRYISARLPVTQAQAWLFWEPSTGELDSERIIQVFQRPGQVWHAGLKLGMRGHPGLLDFVRPTWMFSSDPSPEIEATSWRLSLSACLILTDVLRWAQNISADFETLVGAGLELGYRMLRGGILLRHIPDLVSTTDRKQQLVMPLVDEIRFMRLGHSPLWVKWALLRALTTFHISPQSTWHAWHVLQNVKPITISPFRPMFHDQDLIIRPNVSVLIPTINRYPYLKILLGQLRTQSYSPSEIIVVDQTPIPERDMTWPAQFQDLPLRVFYQNFPGQCSSRNKGLKEAQGDYILLLDDDVEIPSDFIETHLQVLTHFRADSSSGLVYELDKNGKPRNSGGVRASDVFPGGNTLVRLDALNKTGLFDLAYEKMVRADGDLGMRLYLSGGIMLLDERQPILHHRAPQGGLRTHRMRRITYTISRQSLWKRRLLGVSEIYMSYRYFTKHQAHEQIYLNILGTFSIRGNLWRKTLKGFLSFLLLPNTLWALEKRRRIAKKMLATYPQIPSLDH